jgi:hypothetical protein
MSTIANSKTEHPLNTPWVLWYHDPDNSEWTLQSYEKLATVSTIEQYWGVMNNLKRIDCGMFFFMREGYIPMYEDVKQIDGGGLTFKVSRKDIYQFFKEITMYAVGEIISDHPEEIVGISVSPKIQFCSLRVWTNAKHNPKNYTQLKIESKKNGFVIDFNETRFAPNKK